jgi:hypothetical protein
MSLLVTNSIREISANAHAVCRISNGFAFTGRPKSFSRIASVMCPPSSTGNGIMFSTAKLTLNNTMNARMRRQPSSIWSRSYCSVAIPTGPLRWPMPMLESGAITLVIVVHIIRKLSVTCVTGPGCTICCSCSGAP